MCKLGWRICLAREAGGRRRARSRRGVGRADLGRHRAPVLRLPRLRRRPRRGSGQVRVRPRAPSRAAFRQPASGHEGCRPARAVADHQTVARPGAPRARRARLCGAEGRRERPQAAPALRHAQGRGARHETRATADRTNPARVRRRSRGTRGRASLSGRHGRAQASPGRARPDRARRPQSAPAPLNPKPRRAMVPTSAAPSDAAPHLLVVDDDRRIRDLLLRFLSADGYQVTTAETAAEARAKLGGLDFDLLILDVMMPGETGFELARALRAPWGVPTLMLPARDEGENRIKGLELGADVSLAKPFEPRELLLRIANILKRQAPASPPIES